MINLFQRITDTIGPLGEGQKITGWCELEKAHALAATVIALRPAACVEIGVFAGRSLIPIAMALQAVGAGIVEGIDPWSTGAATEGYVGDNAKWWGSLNLNAVHRGFLRDVDRLGLRPHVRVVHESSNDVSPRPTIDLLHVDGQHTDQAVRDVQRFAVNVRIGGVCFMDDIEWVNDGTGAGVQRAVAELLGLGFIQLYNVGTGAAFQRVGG